MNFERLVLDKVVANAARMLRRLIGENIRLETVSCEDPPTVFADPGHIEQVLMNLCVNARDAMPQGGTIRIETRTASVDRAFEETHPEAKAGHYVLLRVSDTGAGMSPEVMEHLFEPFFTTKEVGKGTGLGLATVYGIVKQHGGFIHVDSLVGAGTSFAIYLPVLQGSDGTPGALQPPGPLALRGHGETILLAEDDEAVGDWVQQVLEEAGYRVVVARDGDEAIRRFQEKADEIELAVIDAVMPKRSGRLVYDAILERKPGARVLFASGYSFSTLQEGHLPEKGFDLIPKPFSSLALLQKVREMLERKA